MIGLLNNIKGIGEYIIELWKSGASTIYGEWLPKIVENAGRNFLPMLGNYFKDYLKVLVIYLMVKAKEISELI